MMKLLKYFKNKLFPKPIKVYKSSTIIKNIVLITQFFPPDFAATGQLLDELTEKISLKYPINFHIFTGIPSYAFRKGIKAKKFISKKNRFIRRTSLTNLFNKSILGKTLNGILFFLRITLILLKRTILNLNSDLIVYSTEPAFLPFMGWLIYKINKIPYILIVYDIYPDVLINTGLLKKDCFIVKAWEYLSIKSFSKASEIIVLSKSMEIKLQRYIKYNKPKISIIPSWSDPDQIFKIDKKNNKFAIDNNLVNTFNILYSGNQGRCHDLITIINTAIILKENKSIKFIFIGDGPQNIKIRNIASEFNLENCIFLPYQDKKMLPLTLNIADLALITLNSFSEGLVAPSKLYGHLAASTPVAIVSPRNSYLKELVEKHSFGKWFLNGDYESLANFINNLKLDVELSSNLGNKGREYLLKYANLNKIADEYYSLFNKHMKT